MKKGDWIWLAAVLGAAAVLFAIYMAYQGRGSAAVAVVTVDGEEFGVYPLDQDAQIWINGTNELVIRGHVADMVSADCPDQVCVNQKPASRNGETIVCLPNKVVVEIRGGQEAEVDQVAN